MSDIFISYAREDRPRVEPLAAALAQRGWAVWWDPTIRTGEDCGRRIHTALQAVASLSRLGQQQGKHAEAHEPLAPVY